ncbi:HPP family protein [Bosea sp. BK604]|uniref:HPP family protein n=1 Tax=Bosea sp. BK604 TaxID=2512180 RepID=UPI00104BBF2A|nr:HPP family protein [Bosea sp. BK604]TCR66562.1 HPP family protein [Bosea sp. BK604]
MPPPDAADTAIVQPLRSRLGLPHGALRLREALLAGLGGFLTILALAIGGLQSGALLLIAPFGASCVLVFALPQSPLAQPRNVIGGHLISTIAGLCVLALVGPTPFGLALGVGLAISCMSLTGTLHPPAGADPLVVLMAGAPWPFLITPVLFGALAIVLIGTGFHRLVSGKAYRARG